MKIRLIFPALAAGIVLLPLAAWAAGPQGVDTGWVIDNNGNPLFTSSKASALSAAQVGWVRMEFRLIPGHSTWDSTMLGYYDTVVNTARNQGLQVLGLIDGGSWPGSQSDWCANNWENTGGNGDNTYINNFAASAAVTIIQHFHDRVKVWEIWNEPNAWTSNPSPGVFTGGTYMYPSNFSQLLANTYADVKEYNGLQDVTILSGGVFGHSIGGVYSYQNAGAQYIDNVGINTVGSFAYTKSHWGTYPLDAIGQHIYIDQGGTTTSGEFQQYISWVRQAYTKYEGSGTGKRSFITEFGWTTSSVSQSTQDQDMNISFGVIEGGNVNYVQTAIWFQWQDNPAAGLYYGVIDSSGNPKVCYNDFVYWEEYQGFNADGSINSSIQNYFNARGQPAMGDPYDNGGGPFVHTWSGNVYSAQVQDSNGGSHLRLCMMTSSLGTFEVNDIHGMWDVYLNKGGIGYFGPPKNNEYTSGSGTRQDFQSGHYMTWDSTNGVVVH